MTKGEDMKYKTVSVVVPAYDESECIAELFARLVSVFDAEDSYQWQAVIVENGSNDDTWAKLQELCRKDPRFNALRLSRNFGADGGFTAGLDFITGDACVFMTADLQDPPEMIPVFLREWEQGFENVYGVINRRYGTGPIRTLNSKTFYWAASKLTDGRIPMNASDFRLLDRRAYEAVRSMPERNRLMRGLVAWVGFKSIGIPMDRPERFAGESKAGSISMIALAIRGIFSHSYLPLRLITVVGLATSLLAFLGLGLGILLWFTRGVPFGGFGTIVSLVLLLFGVLTFMLGIVSEYVGLIYDEVKGRPRYIVADRIGFSSNE